MTNRLMGSGLAGPLLIGSALTAGVVAGCSGASSCNDARICSGGGGSGGLGHADDGGDATAGDPSGGATAGDPADSANAGAGGAGDLDAAGAGGLTDAAGAAGAAEYPGLTLDLAPIIRVRRGTSVFVNVGVTRRGSVDGRINVTIQGLPAGVGAHTLVLEDSQTRGNFTLSALQSAEVGGPIAISVTAVDNSHNTVAETASAKLFVTGAPAEVDESFGVGGTVVQSFTTRLDYIQDLAIDAQDRIVLAGAGQGTGAWVGWAARLLPSGALDPRFGTDGKLTNFGPVTTRTSVDNVVIVGDRPVFSVYSGTAGGTYFLRKLLENGAVDSSFGTGGDAILPAAPRVLLHRERGFLALTYEEFKLHAYLEDGTVDSGFTPPATILSIVATTDQKDRVLFGGGSAADGDFTVTRLTAGGIVDSTFGNSGIATVPIKVAHRFTRVGTLIAAPDDRSVFLGDAQFGDIDQSRVSVFRLDAKGVIDSTFGASGELVLTNEGVGLGAVMQDDGKLVAAYGDRLAVDELNCAIARIDQNGKLDTTFAVGGILKLVCPDHIYYEQPGNRLLIANTSDLGVQLTRIWL